MATTAVVVIGAGPAGLAMSRCLGERSVDHVVLERADVAHSWRTERWDSLRLLTPNWMSGLPGQPDDSADPHGYLTAREVVERLDRYAQRNGAPIVRGARVHHVRARGPRRFEVASDAGTWHCSAVVVATGACSTPRVPAIAGQLPADVLQLAPMHYRRPSQLPDGPVVVVGASASGVQIADELARAGRRVTIAVGAHSRLPRTYRGVDIHAWMRTLGLLDTTVDEVDDLERARRWPSLQLIGTPERRTLDLNALAGVGVEIVGRAVGVDGDRLQLSGSLANVCADADLKMHRLLDQIDPVADAAGLPRDERPRGTSVPTPRTVVPIAPGSLVVWATGFRPSFPFLDTSLLDRRGAVVHDGGRMREPGMFVLGQPFLRRRSSTFIDGIGRDAVELGADVAAAVVASSGRRAAARAGVVR